MKGIFNRIVTKVNQGTSSLRQLQIAKRLKKSLRKQDQTINEDDSNQSDSQQESEIVDILIKMKDHLRITKVNSALQGEFKTLKHINRMLCENPLKADQIRLLLLTKSSQKVELQSDQEQEKEGTSNKSVLVYYTKNSNGLIYQYYSVRALLWKVSLGYLPAVKNKWVSVMEGSLLYYHEYLEEHILEIVSKKKRKRQFSPRKQEEEEKYGRKQSIDHPLNSLKDSRWKTFFDDKDLWNIIQKDTMRTKPNCKFLREEFQISMDQVEHYQMQRCEVHLSKEKRKTYYYDCVTRIIYIFLKTNQDFTYCQGMNELASLILYSFANKNSQYFRRVAQSDAFLCFEKIMRALMKVPIPGFLNGQKYSQRFEELLKKIDLRLYQELASKPGTLEGLHILSIKWFGSFFLNQYEMDESLILWDGFITTICQEEVNTISFHNLVLSIGLALVHLNRNALSDGQNPLILFSKLPNAPEVLLQKAMNLYKIFRQYFC